MSDFTNPNRPENNSGVNITIFIPEKVVQIISTIIVLLQLLII